MPRVPRLFRIDDDRHLGKHSVSSLEAAWASRGRDVGFATGGMNLDTLLELRPVSKAAHVHCVRRCGVSYPSTYTSTPCLHVISHPHTAA